MSSGKAYHADVRKRNAFPGLDCTTDANAKAASNKDDEPDLTLPSLIAPPCGGEAGVIEEGSSDRDEAEPKLGTVEQRVDSFFPILSFADALAMRRAKEHRLAALSSLDRTVETDPPAVSMPTIPQATALSTVNPPSDRFNNPVRACPLQAWNNDQNDRLAYLDKAPTRLQSASRNRSANGMIETARYNDAQSERFGDEAPTQLQSVFRNRSASGMIETARYNEAQSEYPGDKPKPIHRSASMIHLSDMLMGMDAVDEMEVIIADTSTTRSDDFAFASEEMDVGEMVEEMDTGQTSARFIESFSTWSVNKVPGDAELSYPHPKMGANEELGGCTTQTPELEALPPPRPPSNSLDFVDRGLIERRCERIERNLRETHIGLLDLSADYREALYTYEHCHYRLSLRVLALENNCKERLEAEIRAYMHMKPTPLDTVTEAMTQSMAGIDAIIQNLHN